ncbi:IS5 family transposase [Cognatiyoonia sp. IB215182]|uniref:IS5 family transposase n=1 Tax=Cognatiyoonia sp. IB215182 TaxID=3097353 RepID=UPI002A0E0BB0|nr:IS5 family transposase [Cognatiyoonia sp. IB215182]MDX8355420.1 IS5 family transposase [Cognatiyoonia sp. IB215182]
MARLEPFSLKFHGKPRVDDRRMLRGIIFINRNGLRWRDTPKDYGPQKTLYNRWNRWRNKGIFAQMMVGLAADHGEERTVMIGVTYLKVHHTASSFAVKKGGRGSLFGRTKGGRNAKLHAACHSKGRPLNLFLTAGQVRQYIGARALLNSLPDVDWLLGDRGYDANWFREALKDKGIPPCLSGRRQRKMIVKYDKRRYKRRNRIEIMFGRLNDWRRVATRYDCCPKVFLSVIALAAPIVYWL